jgi:hypothetical protein
MARKAGGREGETLLAGKGHHGTGITGGIKLQLDRGIGLRLDQESQ